MKEQKTTTQPKNFTRKGDFFSSNQITKDTKVSLPSDQRETAAAELAGQIMGSTREAATPHPGPAFISDAKSSTGTALPKDAKTQMERSFGRNFSDVRIHTDDHATQLSKDINAKAFTLGSDIFFQKKYFDPRGGLGKRLLAHELAHTIQQKELSGHNFIQREGEEQKDKAKETPKVETKVEVVTEQNITKGETKGKATTTRSAEQSVGEGVTAKATEKTTGDARTASAELAAKDKATGLSVSTGIKAEESTVDPTQADKAKGFIKLGGSWTLFDARLKLESGISAETDFKYKPSVSIDGKAVFFPNGRLSPELAGKFLYGKEGPSGQITPGLNFKITDALSAKAGVPITIDSSGKVGASVGLGFVIKFP